MEYRFRRIRARSLWREMAIKGARVLRELEDLLGVVNGLYTLAAFVAAALCAPLFLILYFVVEWGRRACARRLQRKHPELEVVRETTVRSAMDTKRNQGVVTAVLQVKGRCDIAQIKASLQEKILNKKDADGKLSYPHLRMALTTRSMLLVVNHYAWQPVPDFSLDNHLHLGSNLFRGRPVSELNIQEYVSEVVSKYLAPELPPWQVVVIPCAGQEERYYVVVRVHHLLLSEGSLGLDDVLQMKPQVPAPLQEDDENPVGEEPRSLFTDLAPPLVASAALARSARKAWGAFVQDHDPAENVDVLKKRPGLQVLVTALVIANVAVARKFLRGDVGAGGLARLVVDEYSRRCCTPGYAWRAVVNSCWPTNVAWWLVVGVPRLALGTPWLQRCSLTLAASAEAWRLWRLVYTAPRILLEDLFFSQKEPRHQLQTVSLCGRKVVAWSAPVPLQLVCRLAAVMDVTPGEVLIAATSGALRDYFRQLGLETPESVHCTARRVSGAAAGGLLCLALPTRGGGGDAAAAREAVREARGRQAALHLLSSCLPEGGLLTHLLPAVFVRLLLNHVTRRYAVTLAEVPRQPSGATAWGHSVEQLMYWRPPQSNICMALTLMQYGHVVRLGVMTDALLSPQHAVIASGFNKQLSELASSAGVPRDRASFC